MSRDLCPWCWYANGHRASYCKRLLRAALLIASVFLLLDCNLVASWTCTIRGLQMCGPVAMTLDATVSVPYGTGPGQAVHFYNACSEAIAQGQAMGLLAVTCDSCVVATTPPPQVTQRPPPRDPCHVAEGGAPGTGGEPATGGAGAAGGSPPATAAGGIGGDMSGAASTVATTDTSAEATTGCGRPVPRGQGGEWGGS